MIRKAMKEDVSRITEIHIFGWRSAYRGIISDEYLFSEITVQGRIDQFLQRKEDEIHDIYVYEENKIVKGFMKIGKCRNEDKLDSFELWGLYVEPLMKNQGIGTKLLKYCEEVAQSMGYKENVLWVLEKNKDSRKFYEKMGYTPDGNEVIMEKFNVKEIRYTRILD